MSSTTLATLGTHSSSSLKPKLEEIKAEKKFYEEKDVIYHIAGVETCFIDLQATGPTSLIPISKDDDLYVILCAPEGIDDPASEGLPPEILYLKAGRISCPLSPNQPTMRKNHQDVRLAYLFPMEIALDENSDECKFVVFAVILPATFEKFSPIVLGFEDLLHKFTLFTFDEDEPQVSEKQRLALMDAPALPKSVDDPDTSLDWDVVYSLSPVHCCVIDLEALDDDEEEDQSELEEEKEGSYELGQSKVNVLLCPPKELVAIQVATKSLLLHSDLIVKRKYYEDERLVYFFPFYEKVDEEDEDESELVLTVVLPPEMTENTPEVIGFEDLLHKFARLIIEEVDLIEDKEGEVDPNADPVFEKPELAIKIERTGYKVRTAIVQSAVHMGKGIFWTSNYINKHVRPNQKPTKVSPKTMARIYNARVVSGKVFGVSVKTLNMWNIGYKKIGSVTVALWAQSPLYKKVTSGATTKNQAAVRDLFGAGSEAVMGLYYGLKDAGRILGECSKAATVNVIRHKWGEEAGYAAQESLNVVRDLALAGWYSWNALTPSWQQVLREGTYELFDQLSNFRNWISARVLRVGTIYFKIPLLISSNYSVRFLVMTEEALVVFYDKEHYLRSMAIAFPDRTEIFEAALKGDVVIRDWRPGMKIPGVEPKEEKKKRRRRKKKQAAEGEESETKGEQTSTTGEEDGETKKEGETDGEETSTRDSKENDGEDGDSDTSSSESEDEELKIAPGVVLAAAPAEDNKPAEIEVEATTTSSTSTPADDDTVMSKSEETEVESSNSTTPGNEDEEMPQLEVTPASVEGGFATPVPPPKRYKSKYGNPMEVRELSSVDKATFKRSGFASVRDIKIRGKEVKTKNWYRKAYMYVAAMPLEEMDYVRYEDEATDVIQRHTRPYTFCIQTRDGTWTYYSADSYVETSDWAEELNRFVVLAKEKRANKMAVDDMTVDNPNLPKFSDHDYISWLPKEMAKPTSLPSAAEVQLLPKKLLSSTELSREVHEGKDFGLVVL